MNLDIGWSEIALQSLAEVLEYTMFQHGERQAQKMRKLVMDDVQSISRSPYIAAVEPYSKRVGVELRGYLVIPRIKIIYTVRENKIVVDYIKNTFMSERTMLRRMGYFLDL